MPGKTCIRGARADGEVGRTSSQSHERPLRRQLF